MKRSIYTRQFKRLFLLAYAALLPLPVAGQAPAPIGPVPNAHQVEWHHRERMAFFHFNMNTFTNVEWGTGNESPTLFNPTALDCRQWIRTVKQAGFTTAILTVKHHDGFCLWPTATTTHDVASSTWRGGAGNVVREFTDACAEYGVKAGFYLSPWDMNQENLGTYGTPAYVTIYANQLQELARNYGTFWELWWDGAGSGTAIFAADYQRWYDTLVKYQPATFLFGSMKASAIVEGRWVGNEAGTAGDPCYATIDRSVIDVENTTILNAGQINGTAWVGAETDVSIRPGWYWHAAQDNQVKTVTTLRNLYFTSTARNTVWLLNIPPDNRGLIKATDSIRLDSLNCWIYGTFLTNLAAGATVTSNHSRGTGYAPANLVDGLESTYFSTPDATMTDTVVFNLGSSKTFDVVMVQEVIQLGHRTTGWSVDWSTNGTTWTAVTGATNRTCIGYKWLIRVATPVTASWVRLRITAGRACPAIHTFGLFLQAFVRPTTAVGSSRRTPEVKNFTITIFGNPVALPASFTGRQLRVEILDLRGRAAARTVVNADGSTAGPRTALPRGVYLARCSAGGAVAVQKCFNLR
jgi:alpha-L-fucosidase